VIGDDRIRPAADHVNDADLGTPSRAVGESHAAAVVVRNRAETPDYIRCA
jgi:hypothetical protein